MQDEAGGARLRWAVPADADVLAEIRLDFMRIVKDGGLAGEDEWRRDLVRYFGRGLAVGRLRARLAVHDGLVVATAALRIDRPRRGPPGARDGYVMSMYTRPDWRRRGIARALLAGLVEEARTMGLGRLVLHPTEDGRPLYTDIGFKDFRNVMILDLGPGKAGASASGGE